MKSVVAIVGRANVGKSTLFNRLAGEKLAIVEDLPGTTRDRVFADIVWNDREMMLVDTAGLEPKPGSSLAQKVRYQVEAAINDAEVLIFMVDVRDGIIAADQEIAEQLRGRGKAVILAVNKVDNTRLQTQMADFYQLGLDDPLAISAHHGRGITDLMAAVLSLLPESTIDEFDAEIPKLAIVGRPNVGKSMLFNSLIGEDRVIVDEVAGTTRDAVDSTFLYDEQKLLLIDTAGVKKRGRVGIGVEYYSVIRTLRAISRCDIALLVTDATEFMAAQDAHIAGYIKQACKGMILLVNKWDLVSDNPREVYANEIRRRLKFMSHAPVFYVSAKTGAGVNSIMPKVMQVWFERQKHLPDDVIDTLIKEAVLSQTPPRKGFRQLEVVRAYQSGVNPPTFALLVNDPNLVHFSYQRYLENKLRQTFGFSGTSLQLIFRKAPIRRRRKARSGRK
jgi:GTP-binding protein